MVPTEVTWRALEPLTLALLDEHFEQEMCAYPEVIAELIGRIARRSGVQAERLAIIQQPRLTARLHFLLWQLADDFGRVERGGVVLSLRLSHSVLADLVSAQRPSVSHALKQLERHGLVGRRSNGYWWLAGRPPEGLADFAEATRARA